MAFDEALAARVRALLDGKRNITEKKMFGGICFLLDDKMVCGVEKTNLMVRVGPERYDEAMTHPGARPMDFTGRVMRGFLFVDGSAVRDRRALQRWVDWCVEYVGTVKKKPAQARKSGRRPTTSRRPPTQT